MEIDFFQNAERIGNWSSFNPSFTGPGGPIRQDTQLSVPRRGDHVIIEAVLYKVDRVTWLKKDYVHIEVEGVE